MEVDKSLFKDIMRINGHGHMPEPYQIPKFMKDKKLFWIDEDKKFEARRLV